MGRLIPLGRGPFKFVSWKENDAIELEGNPDYFPEPGFAKAWSVATICSDERGVDCARGN